MLMYGMAPSSFWQDKETEDPETGIKHPMTEEEAEEIFAKYFKSKPKVKQLIDESHRALEKQGYIEIPGSGFRRIINEVWSTDYGTKNGAYRTALNTMVQGGSAYLTQLALILINRFLKQHKELNAEIVVTVHDSITLSCAFKDVPKVAAIAEYIMEHLPVPYLKFNFKGKDILFPMEAEPEVGGTYGYEFGYNEEDFTSFKSIKGYAKYYKGVKLINDKFDSKLITPEEQESQLKQWEKENKIICQSIG